MNTPQIDSVRFEALFVAHADRVARFVSHRVPPDEVDDVVSEVFTAAWRDRLRIPGDALPWLLGTARRRCAQRHRDHARRERLVDRIVLLDSSPVEADPTRSVDDRDAVLAALSRLGRADQEVLVVSAWYGLTAEQASAVLGVSAPTYAVRLHRARKRLAAAYRAHERLFPVTATALPDPLSSRPTRSH